MFIFCSNTGLLVNFRQIRCISKSNSPKLDLVSIPMDHIIANVILASFPDNLMQTLIILMQLMLHIGTRLTSVPKSIAWISTNVEFQIHQHHCLVQTAKQTRIV